MITHGSDLVRVFHGNHPYVDGCLGCTKSTNTTALVRLVYTFETCNCGHAPYVHLVERAWHRPCFVAPEAVSS